MFLSLIGAHLLGRRLVSGAHYRDLTLLAQPRTLTKRALDFARYAIIEPHLPKT